MMTIAQINQATELDGPPVSTKVLCQVIAVREGETKQGKPYFDVEIADSTGSLRFKVWEDATIFPIVRDLPVGAFVELASLFSRNRHGINCDRSTLRGLTAAEQQAVLAGTPERVAFIEREYQAVEAMIAKIADPRYRLLAERFLEAHGAEFSRSAAARDYHHARRGGLLEHVAQMMRSAEALRSVYPHLNIDLVLVGALFHDCGKIWENNYEKEGFAMPHTLTGELVGHISSGIEIVNRLWHEHKDHPAFAGDPIPSNRDARLHLLHLIASHHGELQYGSPITPRTPEAMLLHHLDNIDAKLEMFRACYAERPEVAPGIFDRRAPLDSKSVASLRPWQPPTS